MRLEGDQDGFGGGDATTARELFTGEPVRKLVCCEEKERLPAGQTIVQAYFGGLEFLRAAAASARACILSYLEVGTTSVDSNLSLHHYRNRIISSQ